jgi:hypothetical protein
MKIEMVTSPETIAELHLKEISREDRINSNLKKIESMNSVVAIIVFGQKYKIIKAEKNSDFLHDIEIFLLKEEIKPPFTANSVVRQETRISPSAQYVYSLIKQIEKIVRMDKVNTTFIIEL